MVCIIKFRNSQYFFNVKSETDLTRIIIFSIKNQIDLKEIDLKEIIKEKTDKFVEDFNNSKKLKSDKPLDVRVDYSDDENTKYILTMSEESKLLPLSVPYCVCSLTTE